MCIITCICQGGQVVRKSRLCKDAKGSIDSTLGNHQMEWDTQLQKCKSNSKIITLIHYYCHPIAHYSTRILFLLSRSPRHSGNARVLTIPYLMESTPMTRAQKRSEGDHCRRSPGKPYKKTERRPTGEESNR